MQFTNTQWIIGHVKDAVGSVRRFLMDNLRAICVSGASFCREAQDFSQIKLVCSRCLLVVGRLQKIFLGGVYAQLSAFFLGLGSFMVALLKGQLLELCLNR